MITKRFLKNIIRVFLCIYLLTLPKLNSEAATGSVTYGSANYRWEDGTTNPIGVYISGDEAIVEYEVVLSYDSEFLRYIDGASEVRGNTIYLRGKGKEAGYRHTLRFEVIKEGNSRIRAVSANALTDEKIVSVSGNDVKKEKQQFSFSQLSTAPIATSNSISSMLADLSLIPNVLQNFETEKLDYAVEVPYDVDNIRVNYVLEDAAAEASISDTSLAVGDNEVTVKVKGSSKETVYKIIVKRMEMEESSISTEASEEILPTPSPEKNQVENVEESSIVSSIDETVPEESIQETLEGGLLDIDEPEDVEVIVGDTEQFIDNIILLIGCIFVATLMIGYFVCSIKQRISEATKRKEEKKEVQVVNLEGTVISVRNVTMKFKMAKDESSSLKEYLIRFLKKKNEYTYFTALDNISFDVMQGDVVGIIGTNGSGKSTTLKIVSGVLVPTQGSVKVDRSKVQMLTLGTGFDMELTARENVFLNGAIIGYTREYIEEKYDDIVKFAELEGFMEERMKNFSSGMVSRLGFAIATMRDAPDILILDEVLSVGDMFFRQKSEQRIKEMIHGGATVLIVSHSMDTIKKNCNKVVWIEKGVLQMVGDPKEVCEAYAKKNNVEG